MAGEVVTPEVSAVPRRQPRLRINRWPASLWVGGFILVVFALVALTGHLWAPYDPTMFGTGIPFSLPGNGHLLGTDQLGRDVFSRIVDGAPIDLFLALASTLVALIIGGSLGLLSGYVGGWLDDVLMRFFDGLISIPLLIFALLIIAAAGPTASGSMILLTGVVALVYMPRIARMARAVAIDLATRDFVTVARTRGESPWSIVRRELAPNATGVLLVEFGVRAGYAPIIIGSLGFLGFGARPPTPEWGLMISENRAAITADPIVVLAPALALALLVVGLNLFTDGFARLIGRSIQRSPL